MAKITGKTDLVSPKVLTLLERVANATKNPEVHITSTWRSPEDQARIMDANLRAGTRISYKAPGAEVTALWDALHKTHSPEDTRAAMAQRIAELAQQGRRVSNHCVTREQYDAVNILDVSRYMPNPRDFTKALAKEAATVKILTPITDTDYGSDRVIKMASEPAIHVEINVAES